MAAVMVQDDERRGAKAILFCWGKSQSLHLPLPPHSTATGNCDHHNNSYRHFYGENNKK
jgi:hypothetical protein